MITAQFVKSKAVPIPGLYQDIYGIVEHVFKGTTEDAYRAEKSNSGQLLSDELTHDLVMDESSYFDDEPSSSHYATNGPSGSGLTLRLPPLSSGKTSKSGKKRKSSSFADQGIQAARVLKPVRLKPLREVLSRLVLLIKKCVCLLVFRSIC